MKDSTRLKLSFFICEMGVTALPQGVGMETQGEPGTVGKHPAKCCHGCPDRPSPSLISSVPSIHWGEEILFPTLGEVMKTDPKRWAELF